PHRHSLVTGSTSNAVPGRQSHDSPSSFGSMICWASGTAPSTSYGPFSVTRIRAAPVTATGPAPRSRSPGSWSCMARAPSRRRRSGPLASLPRSVSNAIRPPEAARGADAESTARRAARGLILRGSGIDDPLWRVHDRPVTLPQSGIFALGTASHAYLEFDAGEPGAAGELAGAVASLREPRTTMGGVNLVAGFRPELWREVMPDDTPADVAGFDQPLVGAGGYSMPATQHDTVLWLSGSAYDVVFDMARGAIAALAPVASIAEETSSWPYHHDLDLTGFID